MTKTELMQKVIALQPGKVLRVSPPDMRAAAGVADLQTFASEIKRSWSVSVKKDAVWNCYTLVRHRDEKR